MARERGAHAKLLVGSISKFCFQVRKDEGMLILRGTKKMIHNRSIQNQLSTQVGETVGTGGLHSRLYGTDAARRLAWLTVGRY